MKVVVVGGGVAGLTCAYELRARGHEARVLERQARPGGKVFTERSGEWRMETGPVGVLDNAPGTQTLFDQLGLQRVVSSDATRRRFILLDGKLRELPDSPPKILTSGALTLGEKWRLFREPKAPPAPAGVDETMREFAVRRLGASLAERFVEPVASGIYAGDYARLSLRSAFPLLAELEREHGSLLKGLMAREKERKAEGRPRQPARLMTLDGGMGALPAALARSLGDALSLGVTVQAIEKNGEALRVRTDLAGTLDADRVVLALPADEASTLMQPLDAAVAEAWAAIPIGGAAAVTLGWPRGQVAHPLDGFGFLAPRREKQRLLGVIFLTSVYPDAPPAPPGHVALRCMVGGAHDPEAANLAEDALIAIARDGVRATLGIDAAPTFTHVVRWPRAIAQYVVGHAGRVATIEERSIPLGIFPTGAGLRGVGVNDVIREARAMVERLIA